MSLGDTDTIVPYNQSREIYCDLPLGKFDFESSHSSFSSYIEFYSHSEGFFDR